MLGGRGAEMQCTATLRPLKCGLLGADASVRPIIDEVLHPAYEVRADLGREATEANKLEVQRVLGACTVFATGGLICVSVSRFGDKRTSLYLLLCLRLLSRATTWKYLREDLQASHAVHASVLSAK